MTGDLAKRDTAQMAVQDSMSINQLIEQVSTIQHAMSAVMKDGEHFGVIPGTNKPTLLKPGAEKLLLLFRLGPRYKTDKTFHEDGHLTVTAICELVHIVTGNFVAEGEGMCSTKEAKYAYRRAERVCPQCNEPAIIKGRAEYGGGWVCFKRRGGCGTKFRDGDQTIEGQEVGRIPNADLADSYNTVLKMACKRALIAAVLNGTAASDIFTQDLDERAGISEDEQVAESRSGAGSATAEPSTARPVQSGVPGASVPPQDVAPPQGVLGGGESAPTAEPERDPSSENHIDPDERDRLWSLIDRSVREGIDHNGQPMTAGRMTAGAQMIAVAMGLGKVPDMRHLETKAPGALLKAIVDKLGLEERFGAGVAQ